jgi:ADP-ribosylglycohydrolase
LFHTQFRLRARRRAFLWRANARASQQRIIRVAVPFSHRDPEELVAPGPSDDTELALLTARILLHAGPRSVVRAAFADGWRRLVLPSAEETFTGFAERAALDNLARGLEPPASGGDNPQHYDDAACARAVSIGIAFAGDPAAAARVAEWDAEVTHAEDGIFAAQAMAVAIAALVEGAHLRTAVAAARATFPASSWIASMDARAQRCADRVAQRHSAHRGPEGSARSAAEDLDASARAADSSAQADSARGPEGSARSAAEDHRPDRQSTGEREQRAQRR